MDLELIKAMIVGHAIGDALGVPVEFMSREKIAHDPVAEMRGYGTHHQPPGTWSDDTSMTLCLLESIVRLERIDYKDIMDNFVSWLRRAEFTATGITFDVGIASQAAIHHYEQGCLPLACGGSGEYDNGNGSLMRIAPLAIYLWQHNISTVKDVLKEAHHISRLTHAHPRSQMACGIYTLIAMNLLRGQPPLEAIEKGLSEAHAFYERESEFAREVPHYGRLWNFGSFAGLAKADIRSSGYVVDTLEASLWCLANTKNYREAVLAAVNLGNDTDTIGAIVGGLAGLAYGWEDIPQEWKNSLIKLDYMEELCQKMIYCQHRQLLPQ